MEWLHDHSSIQLETTLFDDPTDAPHIALPDVIIDLLPCYDQSARSQHSQQSIFESLNPLAHPDPTAEPVRLEFRALNSKLDNEITDMYFRLVGKRGSTLGDNYMNIASKWADVVYPSVWDKIKQVAGVPLKLYNEEVAQDQQEEVSAVEDVVIEGQQVTHEEQ